jgi:hypothetical protein
MELLTPHMYPGAEGTAGDIVETWNLDVSGAKDPVHACNTKPVGAQAARNLLPVHA